MQHGKTGAGTSSWLLIPLAAALIVIGAKFWMIARYGFPMPIGINWTTKAGSYFPNIWPVR